MSESDTSLYDQLAQMGKKQALLQGISMLLEWDQETYMPSEGIGGRAPQLEMIASLHHKEKTSEGFKKTLSKLIDLKTGKPLDQSLSSEQKAAVREWRRDYLHESKLPTSFVEEFARVTSHSTHAWREGKKKNDFSLFQPHLEKVIELSRKKADILGYKDHPYDALMDLFEPEMSVATIAPLFHRLKIPLTTLFRSIQAKPAPDDSFLHKPYDHARQLAAGKRVLEAMGFDQQWSRLDESAHPMCIPIYPRDTRMTTRVYPNNVIVNILSCIHEGGHGLYHSHLPVEHYGTPLCESVSLGIDESQSRTWETIVGRSLPFWRFALPILQELFPIELGSVTPEQFYAGINRVAPTMIRVDSDEVSYNLHVMLRFELELALIEGILKVKDLPEAWNEKMQNYLGICPKSFSEGVMQDVHWSLGLIGYFPTYTLGNLYAAQFFETFKKTRPNWSQELTHGQFSHLREWQTEHIHRHGRRFLPTDLCKQATGAPLSEDPYLSYLKGKYSALFHL